jgi:hypothetical protein
VETEKRSYALARRAKNCLHLSAWGRAGYIYAKVPSDRDFEYLYEAEKIALCRLGLPFRTGLIPRSNLPLLFVDLSLQSVGSSQLIEPFLQPVDLPVELFPQPVDSSPGSRSFPPADPFDDHPIGSFCDGHTERSELARTPAYS